MPRIIFMGTPEFAVASLDALIKAGMNVVAVVTAPDKAAGRGQKLSESAVKLYAKEHQLLILQPERLKSPEFIAKLADLKPDLQIVVAFRMLPQEVWSMPHLGTFNLHASLLPNFRGAAPINHAIIQGESETGVSSFLLDKEIDTGAILFQEKTSILPEDNAGSLHDRLMQMGAALVVETTKALINGTAKAIPQNAFVNSKTLSAPKIFKKDCEIDWHQSANQILQLIKGLSPYPAAISELWHIPAPKGIQCKIFDAEIIKLCTQNISPGEIITDGKNYLYVACKNNEFISIKSIQLSGKKRLDIYEFLRGFHLQKGEIARFQAITSI